MKVFRFLRSLSLLEITLIQLVGYALVWLYNEYVGTLLTFVIVPICLGILLISFISDRIEKSKVGSKYYWLLILSTITPLLVAGFFVWIYEGSLDFLNQQ